MSLAAVMIKSPALKSRKFLQVLYNLKLRDKNRLSVFKDGPGVRGMLNSVRDIITWGIVDDETLKRIESRKRTDGTYALNPPKKGFGGTKSLFSRGGSTGDRGDKMKELVESMA